VAWQRVVLLCLSAIRQPYWWSRRELSWYSHGSFISNGLGMSFLQSWSFIALRDTIGRPLIENVRHDVVASCHLGPCCRHTRWCLRGWWKQDIDLLIWGELLPTSHQPPSLSPGKVQC
jgi:hypothetical protein